MAPDDAGAAPSPSEGLFRSALASLERFGFPGGGNGDAAAAVPPPPPPPPSTSDAWFDAVTRSGLSSLELAAPRPSAVAAAASGWVGSASAGASSAWAEDAPLLGGGTPPPHQELHAPPPSSTDGGGGDPVAGGELSSAPLATPWSGPPPAPAAARAVYEVLRIDPAGKKRRIYVRRRDLLRANRLQPRDLRRIDPSLSLTKTSPNITVRDEVLLINLGGVRAIVGAERCLLFEPGSVSSWRFLDILVPRLQAADGARVLAADWEGAGGGGSGGGFEGGPDSSSAATPYPSALGVWKGGRRSAAAGVASADSDTDGPGGGGGGGGGPDGEDEDSPPFELEVLEAALLVATGRLDAELLAVTKRVAAILQMLPRDVTPVNLEELRRVKQALVELESRGDSLREVLEEVMDDEDELRDMNLSSRPAREEARRRRERERLARAGAGRLAAAEAAAAAQRSRTAPSPAPPPPPSPPTPIRASEAAAAKAVALGAGVIPPRHDPNAAARPVPRGPDGYGLSVDPSALTPPALPALDAEAAAALAELTDAEKEEREVEEAEDLLEYYLQRAATTASEAARLLAGARDLEESIAVSLSARRFELNRLELTLSIGSFAAALGAVVAGIFGMNLRSTLEASVLGFWGTTGLIIVGCVWVFVALYTYTRKRRIL